MTITGKADSPEALGRILQQACAMRGLTQRDLAEQLGVSQRYIWEIETGKHSIFAGRLVAIARATGVRLLAEIDEPEE